MNDLQRKENPDFHVIWTEGFNSGKFYMAVELLERTDKIEFLNNLYQLIHQELTKDLDKETKDKLTGFAHGIRVALQICKTTGPAKEAYQNIIKPAIVLPVNGLME